MRHGPDESGGGHLQWLCSLQRCRRALCLYRRVAAEQRRPRAGLRSPDLLVTCARRGRWSSPPGATVERVHFLIIPECICMRFFPAAQSVQLGCFSRHQLSPCAGRLPRTFLRLSSAGWRRPRSRPSPHPAGRTHAEVDRWHAPAPRTRTPKINITAGAGSAGRILGQARRSAIAPPRGVIELAAVGSDGEAASALNRLRPGIDMTLCKLLHGLCVCVRRCQPMGGGHGGQERAGGGGRGRGD